VKGQVGPSGPTLAIATIASVPFLHGLVSAVVVQVGRGVARADGVDPDLRIALGVLVALVIGTSNSTPPTRSSALSNRSSAS
jgi:hypothetical protein